MLRPLHLTYSMQRSVRQVGALTPRGHTQTMPPSGAQWCLSRQLCRHMFLQPHQKHGLLRQLPAGVPSCTSKPAFCSATAPDSSHSSFPGLPQPACRATAHQQALRAAAAARTSMGGMFAASKRALTSRSFQGLEPAAFSAQHGLRKSVRLKAISDKGHCGEEGLVKGAGVVRNHAPSTHLPAYPFPAHLAAEAFYQIPRACTMHLCLSLRCASGPLNGDTGAKRSDVLSSACPKCTQSCAAPASSRIMCIQPVRAMCVMVECLCRSSQRTQG